MITRSTIRISVLVAVLCGTYIFLAACGSADNNANLANTIGTGVVNTNGQALPPEFSTKPLNVNGPIPGITTNANQPIKPGATPAPGTPDSKNANQQPRPGATPTPQAPSAQTAKPAGPDSPTMSSSSAPPMMRSTNAGPRTSRKQ